MTSDWCIVAGAVSAKTTNVYYCVCLAFLQEGASQISWWSRPQINKHVNKLTRQVLVNMNIVEMIVNPCILYFDQHLGAAHP